MSPLPIEADQPGTLCSCGLIWLAPWVTTFHAEGAEHGRRQCWPVAS